MTSSSGPMWMDNLSEWILDQDKVITPRYLSRALKLHVNVAKECLFHFCAKTEEEEDLAVVLLLSGRDSNGRGLVRLVRREAAERVEKEEFSQVSSKHVYAVGRRRALLSEHLLAAVMLEQVREFGAVGGGSSHAAIAHRPAVPREGARLQKPTASAAADRGAKDGSTNAAQKTSSEAKVKAEKTSSTETKVKVEALVKDAKKEEKGKKAKGIAGMFARAADAKKPKTEVETSPGKENRDNEEEEKKGVVDKRTADQPAKGRCGRTRKGAKEAKKGAKLEAAQPKRKRIQMMADSDSSEDDDEEEDEVEEVAFEAPPPPPQAHCLSSSEDEDVIPATPVAETRAGSASSGRRRVRRKVERTFTDEEGFTVTKVETVSASESDQEVADEEKGSVLKAKNSTASDSKTSSSNPEATVKPPAAKKPKKSPAKSKNNANNKQASIMNFFKKK